MNTLITRWFWTVVTLIFLISAIFLIEFMHTADMVQGAADAGRSVAAVSSDTSSLETVVEKAISSTLPITEGTETLFNPNQDIQTTSAAGNQQVRISVTYHMPILGPLQHLLGVGATMAVTRTATQSLDYAQNGLNAELKPPAPSNITVSGITLNASGSDFQMSITGKGFGAAPSGVPGTSMGSFFELDDITQGWDAGSPASGLSITYSTWNDTQINLSGIQNYDKGTEVVYPGDDMAVKVTSSEGNTTYYFVASTSGTTQYKASLTASTASTTVGGLVMLTASTTNPGNGTDGVGIYDATTGQYLTWSGGGETVAQAVNSASAQSQDYQAYYGPQGDIQSALATSDDIGVTWALPDSSTTLTAVMMQTNSGAYFIDLYGTNLSGATVSGAGLSGISEVSSSEIQVNAANSGDTSGEVTFSDGSQASFQAIAY